MTDKSEQAAPRSKGRSDAQSIVAKVKAPVVASKTGVTLRKKDFVDRVTEKSGVRKSDARSAVDAALSVLADALTAGDEVVIPPLGKLRMMRQKDNGKARVLTLRLQIIPEGEADKLPLAETKDGG